MKKALLLLVFGAIAARAAPGAAPGASVLGSKHDFSSSGPVENQVSGAESPCIFCHASHGGADGLSNRPDSPVGHRQWDAAKLEGRPGLPNGASRTCLSCHDGTVAVGATRKPMKNRGGGGDRIGSQRRSNLGTDLRTSHPVSMRPAPGRRSRAPFPGDPVALDAAGQVQCTSCHDPHRSNGDPVLGKFLVRPAQRSAICLPCHDASQYEAATSSHAQSGAGLPGDAGGSFRTVGDAGCLACHAAHGTEVDSHLVVRGRARDDDSACLRCHGSGIAQSSVALDMSKPYSHSVPGPHDADEGPSARRVRIPETSGGTQRHAVCVDCHNPHAANSTEAPRPYAGGALAGVWGIDLTGQRVEPVRFEYEVCFKCHGDSANKPQVNGPTPPESVRRAAIDVNLRRVFAPTAISSHPVTGARRQLDVPSLKEPWSSVQSIACSDCHSSSGGGSRGPHGSVYLHLLELEYRTADRTPEGPAAYALCYKCHDREKLLDETAASGFPWHRSHVVGTFTAPPTPCATCHGAHGVSELVGSPGANTHLIDFDVSVVGKSASGRRAFQDSGVRSGSCSLNCHGYAHDGVTYSPSKLPPP